MGFSSSDVLFYASCWDLLSHTSASAMPHESSRSCRSPDTIPLKRPPETLPEAGGVFFLRGVKSPMVAQPLGDFDLLFFAISMMNMLMSINWEPGDFGLSSRFFVHLGHWSDHQIISNHNPPVGGTPKPIHLVDQGTGRYFTLQAKNIWGSVFANPNQQSCLYRSI